MKSYHYLIIFIYSILFFSTEVKAQQLEVSLSTLEKLVKANPIDATKFLKGFQKEHTDNSGIVYYGNLQNSNTVAIERKQGSNIVFYGFDSKRIYNQFYNQIDKISLEKGCNLKTKIDDGYSYNLPIEVSCDCEGYFYYLKTFIYKGITVGYEFKIAKTENKKFIEKQLQSKETKAIVIEEDRMVVISKNAEFPGGQSALREYISKNMEKLKFTNECSGKLTVQFIIEKEGSINNVKIITRPTCKISLEKDLILIFQNMPKWKPAESKNGTPVKSTQTIPLIFKDI